VLPSPEAAQIRAAVTSAVAHVEITMLACALQPLSSVPIHGSAGGQHADACSRGTVMQSRHEAFFSGGGMRKETEA
jgi:hypothetical protein